MPSEPNDPSLTSVILLALDPGPAAIVRAAVRMVLPEARIEEASDVQHALALETGREGFVVNYAEWLVPLYRRRRVPIGPGLAWLTRTLEKSASSSSASASTSRTATIGFVVHHAQYPAGGGGTFGARVLAGASRTLRQRGYDVRVIVGEAEAERCDRDLRRPAAGQVGALRARQRRCRSHRRVRGRSAALERGGLRHDRRRNPRPAGSACGRRPSSAGWRSCTPCSP